MFLEFCIRFSLRALPASTLTLVWFAQFASRSLKAHSSLVGYISGVKKLHLMLGFNTRSFSGYVLRLTLAGLKRLNQHIVKQALPITPVILQDVHKVLDFNSEDDTVFWAICLTAFFLLFRKSNLLPDTKYGFNGNRQLRWCDIVFTDTNAIVGIRWAKNHQFSRQLLTFPLPKIKGSCISPVTAL